MIKDMYNEVVTGVRIIKCVQKAFPVIIDFHQGSASSPYLFAWVIDELTTHKLEEVSWCIFFNDWH